MFQSVNLRIDYYNNSIDISEAISHQRLDAMLPEGPPFTRKCWEACRSVPFGKTITYAELARRAGSPKAMRAAGQAMRKNPLTIITPCHRVISSTGSLHGYAGATDPQSEELKRKNTLLSMNCVQCMYENYCCRNRICWISNRNLLCKCRESSYLP